MDGDLWDSWLVDTLIEAADAKVALDVGVVAESMQMWVGGGAKVACFFLASLSSSSRVVISACWVARWILLALSFFQVGCVGGH